jgi:hypothetical protein
MRRFLIVVEKAGSNFSAYSPDLPGCVATGATPEETKARMQTAIDRPLLGARRRQQSSRAALTRAPTVQNWFAELGKTIGK